VKVYHIPRSNCPLRIQVSDDEIVYCLQFLGEDRYPFYWKLVTPDTAKRLIYEYQMTVAFTLPDTPEDQIIHEGPRSP
jgi:hypothetical protein